MKNSDFTSNYNDGLIRLTNFIRSTSKICHNSCDSLIKNDTRQSNFPRHLNVLISTFVLVLSFSCSDEIPYDLATPEPGRQKVLVEEISGVRCPNCPDGSRLLEALNEDFDSSLIVVTYHAGSFSKPYPESQYDFKTNQTVDLMKLLGSPQGYPSAAIQRIPLPGQEGYQRLPTTWTTTISEALSKKPAVELTLSVDTVNAFTNLKISALFLQNVDMPVFMTAYIIEDDLEDPQADSQSRDEFVPDYVHNHVLREILTPIEGTKWSDEFKALDFKEDILYVELNSLSNIVDSDKTAFIAFVHTEEEVLQVEKIKAIP